MEDKARKYADWIVANADKKGTPEFDTVAQAYKAARQQLSTASNAEPEKVQYYGRNVEDMSEPSKFLLGAGNEVLNLGRGFKQAYKIGDQQELSKDIEESRALKGELEKSDAGTIGGFLGSIAPVIATGGASLPGAVASGMAYGALQPTVGNESRPLNMALGGALGTVGPALGTLAGGVGNSGILRRSEAASRLMDKGIQPTIGQGVEQNILGRALRGIEEGASSIPWVGGAVKQGRDRARNEFSKTMFNEVSSTAGLKPVKNIGEKGVNELYDSFNNAYKTSLKGVDLPITNDLTAGVSSVINDANRFMDGEKRQWLTNFVQSNLSAIDTTGGKISATQLHDVASNLKSKARSLISSQDSQQAEAGAALNDIAESLAEYRNKFIPNDIKNSIKKLDAGYAKYKRLERAASGVGAVDGEFTPAQLYNAIKVMDKSKDKGAFARGKSLMQQTTSDAKSVLSDKLGDSGTAPRMLNSNLLAQALGIAGVAPAKALMSRGVSKYALGGYKGQRPLEKLLRGAITPLSISSVGE
jgi:hypothetical protein